MEVIELKFLLKLVGKESYRAPITELKPNSGTRASQRDKICRDLWKQEYINCTEDTTKIRLTFPGKALLKLKANDLPLTKEELKILKACRKGTITPGKTNVKPPEKRQKLINNLIERGLIEAAAKKFKDVWLTEKGKNFLVKEYVPKGSNSVLSLDYLNNYLRFLRNCLSLSGSPMQSNGNGVYVKDEEILQAIQDLDRKLETNNYLPIFHLRNQLPLSRHKLDQALFRLQEQDKIELSTLADVSAYSSDEINAGISQPTGGSLFFVIVN